MSEQAYRAPILPQAPASLRIAAHMIRKLPAGRYRVMHTFFAKPRPVFLMQLPKSSGGYSFCCDLRDSISREVCFAGIYEPQETALLKAILRPGMIFVDVGANWGYFTLMAANLVGASGRVVALEPDPRLFATLRENADRNKLRQVMAIQVAAAAGKGTVTLAGFNENDGNFGISYIAAEPEDKKTCFQVTADCLDSILDRYRIDGIHLMKMDIEGGEAQALKGLRKGLATKKVKCLLLELHPGRLTSLGDSAEAVIADLLAEGYRGFTIDHSRAATRRLTYDPLFDVREMIRPFDPTEPLDTWPHQLWLA
jgi:FkbM family methyltransferase